MALNRNFRSMRSGMADRYAGPELSVFSHNFFPAGIYNCIQYYDVPDKYCTTRYPDRERGIHLFSPPAFGTPGAYIYNIVSPLSGFP